MKTILIIEDEPHIARFIKKVLEDEAWVVYTAETGQRGLIEAATRRPDLIILDLGLPDSDGLEIINDIRTGQNCPLSSYPHVVMSKIRYKRLIMERMII